LWNLHQVVAPTPAPVHCRLPDADVCLRSHCTQKHLTIKNSKPQNTQTAQTTRTAPVAQTTEQTPKGLSINIKIIAAVLGLVAVIVAVNQ
jgi:hypothetical protein